MSAFKDAGHYWWNQCDGCGMAKFVGNKPADPTGAWECDVCAGVDARIIATRAEGYAKARERVAMRYDAMASHLRSDADRAGNEKLRLERSELAEQWESEARIIRAMQDERADVCRCPTIRHLASCPLEAP